MQAFLANRKLAHLGAYKNGRFEPHSLPFSQVLLCSGKTEKCCSKRMNGRRGDKSRGRPFPGLTSNHAFSVECMTLP